MSLETGYITRAEFLDHIRRDWKSAHGIRAGIYEDVELDYSRVKGLTAKSIPYAGATGYLTEDNPDLQWDYTDEELTVNGKVISGSFASPHDVGSTRQYGYEIHYSGDNQSVTAIRARGSLVTTDAATKTARGGLFQAANSDGIDAGVLEGALIEAIGKSSGSAATITMMRGLLVGSEWDAFDTVTDLRTLHIRSHTRNSAVAGFVSGTGYLLYLENEAVGGNGQELDAGIYFKGTTLSGGIKAFTYGIDFSGAEISTAEIRLQNGELIDNLVNGTINITGNLKITENSDTVTISHDGADAYIKWSDGNIIWITDEGINTNTQISVLGKGTGSGYLNMYDQDNAEWLQLACVSGKGYVRTGGISPSDLRLMNNVAQNITCWISITSGNPYFYIYGYHTAVGGKYLRLSVKATGDSWIEAERNLRLGISGNVQIDTAGALKWGNPIDYGELTWDTGKTIVRGLSGKALSLGSDGSHDKLYITTGGLVGIGLIPTANMVGLSIEAGVVTIKETTTPTADANYGKIYTKNDNKLYFQDGAGTEHEIAYV